MWQEAKCSNRTRIIIDVAETEMFKEDSIINDVARAETMKGEM